eukprot:2483151-Lingulodinium_polyedra.AAC.1
MQSSPRLILLLGSTWANGLRLTAAQPGVGVHEDNERAALVATGRHEVNRAGPPLGPLLGALPASRG